MNKKTLYRVNLIGKVFLLMGIMFLLGCKVEKMATDPLTSQLFRENQSLKLSTANGLEASKFFDFETIFVDILLLDERKQFCIEITPKGGPADLRRAIVTSDREGDILDLPMLFDIDTGNSTPPAGDYEVRIQGHEEEPALVVPFEVVAGFRPGVPTVIPTDANAVYNGGSIAPGGDLYATGGGFPPSTEVHLYVVEDRNMFSEGQPLVDISGGFETVTTNASGEIPTTLIWGGVSASPGSGLDLIGDLQPFGEFNSTDGLREARLTGAIVQNAPSATDIITELTYNSAGNIHNQFSQNEIINVAAIPPKRPLRPNGDAAVYIVNHQDVWQAGAPLVSVVNKSSHEMPNFECLRLVSGNKPIIPIVNEPGLPPGRYDVVIDVGRNFSYDPGTDVLDGTANHIGLVIEGDIPSVRTFVSTDKDFLPVFTNAATTIYAKVVRSDDSPIAGVPVSFRITEGPGNLSTESDVTDENGVATSTFSGGAVGKVTMVEVVLSIEGESFVHHISIWTKISLHNQGSFGTGD